MTQQTEHWAGYLGQGNLFAGEAKSYIQILLDEIAGLEYELKGWELVLWKRRKAPGAETAIIILQDKLKQKRQLLRERRRLT
ncbi:hypothetical protein ES703_11745 [subsurface metagenome]|nr:hypothetical protein [bacterium]